MMCERCIFLSDCNGILLNNDRCNFYLKHSDVDLTIEDKSTDKKGVEIDMQANELLGKR